MAIGAAGLLAFVALRLGGGTGPPLYDGVCLPPHYLMLGANPGPGSASATYTAGQVGQTQELATSESAAPQAQMIIAAGSFTVTAGTSVTVTIAPIPPPAVKPPAGSIAGNVYQFAARSSTGQAVDLVPGHPATIVLEAPTASGSQLTIEHLVGSSWTALKTFTSGCGDTEEAATETLGTYALVAAGAGSSTSPSGQGSSGAPVVLIVVIVVLLLVAAVVATRVSRRRRRPAGRGRRPRR